MRIGRITLATVVVLLVPLIAMQFTDEVDWQIGDFVIAAVLLLGAGLTYEAISRRGTTTRFRAAVATAIAAVLALVWIALAVGLP